jgi:SnoaL-like protein
MSLQTDSPAVKFVRRHIEAYSNGDLDTARRNVAENVVADTNDVHLDGIEAYMAGLSRFAAILDPGSPRVLAARGNENKAIIMTEHTTGGQPLPSARTFELDEDGKITAERVVFFGLAV